MGLKKIRVAVVAILSMQLIACAGNMESFNSLADKKVTANSEITPIVIDEGVSEKTQLLIEEVNSEELKTPQLYKNIEKEEKKMLAINILSFLLALPFKATSNMDIEAQEKLKNPIKSVLNKMVEVVDKAYKADDDLREKLEEIVAELDPELPSHQKAIEKIDQLHLKLDSFVLRVEKLGDRLKANADKIIRKINLKKSTYVIPFDPRAYLLGKAAEYFEDFKIKIDSLKVQ